MRGSFDAFLAFLRGKTGQSLAAVLAAIVLAGGGFWAGRATAPVVAHHVAAADTSYDDSDTDDTPSTDAALPTPAPKAAEARTHSHRGEAEGAAVIAAATKASGTKYVHRNNSDLRKEPSYASQTLKKEPKGAEVQMVALSDKWAQVQDGGVKGWMRYSVLKDDPPGTKHPRKKKGDGGDDSSGD